MTVGILGAGSWGSALALTTARNEEQTFLWDPGAGPVKARKKTERFKIRASVYPKITTTSSLSFLPECQVIILAIPSSALRDVCQQISQMGFPENRVLVGTCKGVAVKENNVLFAEDVVEQELGAVKYGHLGGPGFAKGLIARQDTRLVIASEYPDVIKMVQTLLNNNYLYIYGSDDLIGVQTVGACRTTLSIVMGAADALGYKKRKNTMAAIFGRAAVEIRGLVCALRGNPETILDIAGVGDLYLCDDPQSRNFLLGQRIVTEVDKNLPPDTRVKEIQRIARTIGTVEGYQTSRGLWLLSQQYSLDMPWTEAVYRVCHQGERPSEVIDSIRQRAGRQ